MVEVKVIGDLYIFLNGMGTYPLHVRQRKNNHRSNYRWRGRHGRDRMVVGFTTTVRLVPITTKVVSSNPVHCEVYLIQHYVIKLVSNLRQASGFLWLLQFPPPVKLTTTI